MLVWFSAKVKKAPSAISGTGLWAERPIAAGDVVVVKGGHVFSRADRDALAVVLGPSEIQIGDDLFIGPVREDERDASMMYLNHSCDPNLGIVGQIAFHAMRDIAAGEELTFDYATGDDDDWRMSCRCGSARCRQTVTGRDWQIPELQTRYEGWLSSYLAHKIRQQNRRTV